MSLRDYQQRAIDDLRRAIGSGKRAPCLVIPTGGGKTRIAGAIIEAALARGQRIAFLAHREELVDQSARTFATHDPRVIRASHDQGHPRSPVIVASIPTLAARKLYPDVDIVIFDECHHVKATTWRTIADHYASAWLIGLTATPQRGDGSPLGDVFDSLVIGASMRELIDRGHLVPCRVWAPQQTLDSGELVISPAQAYLQHAEGERAVVFCSTVEHADNVAQEMNDAGIPSAVVSGTGTVAARKDTLARFRRGELRAVVNVHVLTEGWDDPGVSVCILARKPVHAGTYLQMAGRVLRPSPATGKTRALLLDLCGSVHVHGPPDMDRKYSLDGKAISKADRDAIRQCPNCGGVFLADQVIDGVCPQCSMALPYRAPTLARVVGGELIDISSLPKLPPRVVTLSITAKYEGICMICNEEISVGEQIYWRKGDKPRHVSCPKQQRRTA